MSPSVTETGVEPDRGPGGGDETPRLAATGISRRFGETQALASASLDLRAGEIHALLGENGSGKSTLVKVLGGVIPPDSGEITIEGSPVSLRTPAGAARRGISVVYQETLVVDELSLLDNVLMGLDGVVRSRRRDDGLIERVRSVLGSIGLGEVPLGAPMMALDLGQRQLATIARAMVRDSWLLILDEATSALDISKRDAVFKVLDRRREEGQTILLITHRMDEIASVADRVTVLRSGTTVSSVDARTPARELVALMTGDDISEYEPKRSSAGAARTPLLQVKGLQLAEEAAPIDFSIGTGDLVGVAGLEGHGQADFLEHLSGFASSPAGVVQVLDGGKWRDVGGARSAVDSGIVYVPRDRKREGLFGVRSVGENLTLSTLSRNSFVGVLRPRRLRGLIRTLIADLQIHAGNPVRPVAQLSGGNQQKVLLARALSLNPRVLVLNDPLRGVDQGVKRELYDLFTRLAGEGMAIILLSTELEELMMVCPRVAVFHEHSLFAVLEEDELKQENLVAAMFAQRAKEEAG